MNDDIAGLVKRLDSLIVDDPPGGNGFRVDPAIEVRDVVNAASTIRALAADRDNWKAVAEIEHQVIIDYEAKVTEQAAEIGLWKRKADTFKQLADADHERAKEAEAKLREAVEVMKGTLATLVAITSLVIRAEDAKRQPSKVVASDAMFRQMLVDYDNATISARAFLADMEKPS